MANRGGSKGFRIPTGMSTSPGPGRRLGRRGGGGNLLRLWSRQRGGFYRLALAALGVWGIYTLVGSSNGLLRLRALSAEEARLEVRYASLLEQREEVVRRSREDPSLRAERGMREKYAQQLPGEIIYRVDRAAKPDSAGLRRTGGASGVDSLSPSR